MPSEGRLGRDGGFPVGSRVLHTCVTCAVVADRIAVACISRASVSGAPSDDKTLFDKT